MNGVREFKLNFDGSCWPNPGGKAGYGHVVKDQDNNITYTDSGLIGTGSQYSNNYAEFFALGKGLDKIYEILANESFPKASIKVYGDSNLVIQMMNRKFKPSADKLYYPIFVMSVFSHVALIDKDVEVKYTWTPRENNTEADKLSKEK